jgi:hypothetical protein
MDNFLGICACGARIEKTETLCQECRQILGERAIAEWEDPRFIPLRLFRSNQYLNHECSLCRNWIHRHTLVCIGAIPMPNGHKQAFFACEDCMKNPEHLGDILENTARGLEEEAKAKRALKGRLVLPTYAWCRERLGYSLEEGSDERT